MTKKGEECEALARSSCFISIPLFLFVVSDDDDLGHLPTFQSLSPGNSEYSKLVQISPQQFEWQCHFERPGTVCETVSVNYLFCNVVVCPMFHLHS